jgi:RNA polymerase sigma factor (sigma-70 family)
MKWCLACGAVQWGASSCDACGHTYRAGALGFGDLYKSYARQLRRFVRRVAADRGLPESLVDTEGVVHDTFAVLLSGYGQPVRNPAAWLFTVARNQVSEAAAAQHRTAPGDPAGYWDDDGIVWLSTAATAADAEDVRAAREVMQAIAGLPDHQRIATYLRQVQGWSLAEIGAYLGCAASTAGVHISRGTTKVRSSLADTHEYQYASPHGSMHHDMMKRRSWLMTAGCLGAVAGFALSIVFAAAAAGAFRLPSWLQDAAAAGMAAVVAAVISASVARWWRRGGNRPATARGSRRPAPPAPVQPLAEDRPSNGPPLAAPASPDRPERGSRPECLGRAQDGKAPAGTQRITIVTR